MRYDQLAVVMKYILWLLKLNKCIYNSDEIFLNVYLFIKKKFSVSFCTTNFGISFSLPFLLSQMCIKRYVSLPFDRNYKKHTEVHYEWCTINIPLSTFSTSCNFKMLVKICIYNEESHLWIPILLLLELHA